MNIQNLFSAEIIVAVPRALMSWLVSHGIKIVIIFILALVLSKIARIFVSKLIKTIIEKSNGVVVGGQIQEQRAKTLGKVFSSSLKIIIWVIAILMLLPELGINPTPLLAGAGLIGLAIGMGSKSLVQDYLSGLFILLEDQYRVGEEIEISGKKGKVIELSLRRTVIKDSEETLHFIPNGQIKSASNFSRK